MQPVESAGKQVNHLGYILLGLFWLFLFRFRNEQNIILFILLSGAEYHSVHSENGIVPKRTQIQSIPSILIPEKSQKNSPLKYGKTVT